MPDPIVAPPVTDPPAAPPAGAGDGTGAPIPPAGVAPPVTPPPTTSWVDGLSDMQKGLVESKGFKDVGTLIDSYHNLEKMKGVPEDRLLTIPEKSIEDDPEGWAKVHAKLGVPEKATDYAITVAEGTSEKDVKWVQDAFHKLGITKKQGETFIKNWGDYQSVNTADVQEQQRANLVKADRELRVKWGLAYEKNKAIAQNVAEKFGVTPEVTAKLATAMGDVEMVALFHQMGVSMGEANFVSGAHNPPGTKTPDAAKYELDQLKNDLEFGKKLAAGDRETMEKWTRLHEMAHPPTA